MLLEGCLLGAAWLWWVFWGAVFVGCGGLVWGFCGWGGGRRRGKDRVCLMGGGKCGERERREGSLLLNLPLLCGCGVGCD